MRFIIQTYDNKIKDVERFELISNLQGLRKYSHQYELRDSISNIKDRELVVVGDLDFVGEYLKNAYGIENMNPIEVPVCLRKEKYLKRYYNIIKKQELISFYSDKESWFIKNVDKLKLYNNSLYGGALCNTLPEGTYLISEWINIKSEYRIFVLEDNIVGCRHYSGNCMTFPNGNLIQEMVNIYSMDKNRPVAYTLDIAITDKLDTVILEIHPFVSCGTYGFCDYNLIYMYRYGLDYYININKALE